MNQTVSLFCGAGGETLGKVLAFEELGIDATRWTSTAVNHWELAVMTHGHNFPKMRCVQEDICDVTAEDFGLETIDLLWASPSCVHHSRARGGKPKEDQQRSHAWEVVERWLQKADVRVFLLENVPEFEQWGPLDENGKVIKARRGEFFVRFVEVLKALGYTVDWRVLCAADYGDPTIRRRLFLQATKDGQVSWPEQTHRNPKKTDALNAHLPTWRTAAECIDWSIPCPSIFTRKRELADKTKKRIAHGIVKYVLNGKPFIVSNNTNNVPKGVDEPVPTVTTGNRNYLVSAHVLNITHGGRVNSANEPLRTITTAKRGEKAVVAATLIQTGYGERKGQAPRSLDIDEPVGTIVAGGCKHALVATFLAKHYSGVIGTRSDVPLGTVCATDHHSVVAASLVTMRGTDDSAVKSSASGADEPLSTISAGGVHHGLVAAFLTQYYSSGGDSRSADEPLGAVTTLARHGVVTVDIDGETYAIVDIGMRMLEPRELARAMGFPEWFKFEKPDGSPLTKRDSIKMIGNACPVGTVKELIKAVVLQRPQLFGLPLAA